MFFLVVIIVLAVMYGYVGWRLIIPAAFSFSINLLLWSLLVILFILPFLHAILRSRGVYGSWMDIIAWVAYLGFGFFTLAFAVFLAKDILFLTTSGILKLVRIGGYHYQSDSLASNLIDPQRRQAITKILNLGALGVTGIMMGYGIYQARRKPSVVETEVPLKNLPKSLEGFRIVQLTDIHASSTIKRGFIQTCVDMVKDLKPDLIILTGDLVDGSVRQLGNDVAPLADLSAPHGKYFITGNHEYYSGVQQWLDETARLGFVNLLNEHRVIEKKGGRFVLGGVTDLAGRQFSQAHISDPFKAISGSPDNIPKILLAHQPKSIAAAAKAGFDYVISGHTHGGQYFPYHFLVALDQPYISGLHKYGDTMIYVSRGTGYWGPQLRIGARSEITVHKLVSQ